MKNIDFPKDSVGIPNAFIHSAIQGKDWHPITPDTPIFVNLRGDLYKLHNYSKENEVVPVFINEAAYVEKNIAMCLTKREVLKFDERWKNEFLRV